MAETGRLPESYWAATAISEPELPSLRHDIDTEVVVIGAGFTGLAAAAELLRREQPCIVLEAAEVGWGASGRNGGLVVPRFKKSYAALAKKYGSDVVRRMHTLVHEAVDLVEATVEEFGIDCDFARSGNITAAHGFTALADLEADAAWLRAEADDCVPRLLDRQAIADEVGHGRYVGALLDPRGAAIHPLSYSRGLASALSQRGVPIYVGSPAKQLIEDADCVVVETADGLVRARYAVIATNGYSALLETPYKFHLRVVPVSSSVIVTAPLPDSIAATILPQGRTVSDTKHILNYYRKLPNNRVLFGGRGDITGRKESPEIYHGLQGEFRQHFPQAGDASIEFQWSGMVAVTLDNIPHIGWASPRVCYGMGYGGRGVALSNLLGRMLGSIASGGSMSAALMESLPLKPIPFHHWRIPAMQSVAAWYRLKDHRESARARAAQ